MFSWALSAVLLIVAGSAQARYNWKANQWEQVKVEDGISVYRKSFEDSNVKGVAGAALIDAPASKIVWVLMDHEHKDDWVDKFRDARTIETPSRLTSIQYAAFSMPFPVSDRDFVYAYEFQYHSNRNMIEVDVKSVEHKSAPEDDSVGVRGEIIMGKYRLYPSKNGKQTYVEVEYLADPKGLLPSWIVNIVQKNWPYKTIKGLRKQVQKSFVGHHDIVTRGLGVQALGLRQKK
ncbi:START domain-containing protein [Pseudobacteriovorax antillogorgiicola]|uniref:START domain-containing protein n=1 Tax=Pseudobacteriovorax antillogorgiicola TaxID=1513793 RepID=A0A1Y6BVH9_9BACT|nr:START domain-containing protein [Pseudobacteriovorax antillogorgiicola]TCS52333.1 START domain-containing protein [Pseudobacteriovorax antillogorgiicola]SMF29914.1 START domain-containing protein [Pseudobacteriovorax antillogorgiicola]